MAYHYNCYPGMSSSPIPSTAFRARKSSTCTGCRRDIDVGQPIKWFRTGETATGRGVGTGTKSNTSTDPLENFQLHETPPLGATQDPQPPPVAAAAPELGAFGPLLGMILAHVRGPILADAIAEIEAALAEFKPTNLNAPTVTHIHVSEPTHGPAIPTNLGVQHSSFPRLLSACAARDHKGLRLNIWLAGPAGSGKTTAAHAVAQALSLPYYHTGAINDPIELLGYCNAAGTYVSTLFRQAYEHGGVFLFDEIDGCDPRALVALNALLANGVAAFPDGMIQRHPDTVIIAAANTWGHGATHEYVGRMKQDAAFLDRFVRLTWNYDEALERSFAPDLAICTHVQAIRAAVAAKGLRVLVTPRATVRVASLVAAGLSLSDALDACVYEGMTADQARTIRDMVKAPVTHLSVAS